MLPGVKIVVVLAGGPDVPDGLSFPPGAIVIGADGGVALADRVDLAIGDFDSAPPELVERAVQVERYPAEKDATDLELALEAALRFEPDRILLVGSGGGRLDHLLGSLLLLASPGYAAVQVDALLGPAAVHVVRGERVLHGEVGETISLFAAHGPADGVATQGLEYPLRGETLEPGSSRGTSNRFAASEARITVARGALLVVRPTCSARAGTG
jgi:thiamine pyrophosphokinase